VCNRARRKQRGVAFWFVKQLEGSVCPFCKAYEKVHGRKAHEPVNSHDDPGDLDRHVAYPPPARPSPLLAVIAVNIHAAASSPRRSVAGAAAQG